MADTATEWEDMRGALVSLNELMGECNRLVHTVSGLEKAHRRFAEEIPYDHEPGEYTEVMGFIAGVGAACAGVALQLQSVERVKETNRFQCDKPSHCSPPACLSAGGLSRSNKKRV